MRAAPRLVRCPARCFGIGVPATRQGRAGTTGPCGEISLGKMSSGAFVGSGETMMKSCRAPGSQQQKRVEG